MRALPVTRRPLEPDGNDLKGVVGDPELEERVLVELLNQPKLGLRRVPRLGVHRDGSERGAEVKGCSCHEKWVVQR